MLPVIAIVGRPNVGKSTLFNRITRSRMALVADIPGVTRDRLYGTAHIEGKSCIVIDTGGLVDDAHGMAELMLQQAKQAIAESDIVLYVVDARAGRTAADEVITNQLRRLNKKVFLLVNKVDGIDPTIALLEFHRLGLGQPKGISAEAGTNVNRVLAEIAKELPDDGEPSEQENETAIKIAMVGRPNVGKSTLINRILGFDRVIVSPEAGTTRDSVYIPFQRFNQNYILIDTAGMRRKARISEMIEKFSIVKTLQAIEDANVVVFVLDAKTNVVEQDLKLLGFILEQGKSLVVVINKWDGLQDYQKQRIKQELSRRLRFVDFVKMHFISALHGTGVGDLYSEVDKAYTSAMKRIPTPQLTKLLEQALRTHEPPLVQGHRIKLRYAHQGGHNPPLIIIHGSRVEHLPNSYKKFLENYFRERLHLSGTPIRFIFKSSESPYKGRSVGGRKFVKKDTRKK
jgi:GTP-binding protein